MKRTSYVINRGINRPVSFKGLQAQYIWYAGGATLGTLVLFGVLIVAGVNSYLCVPLALVTGGILIVRVYRLNKRYGEFGMMKRRARRQMPVALISPSRKFFIQLFKDYAG